MALIYLWTRQSHAFLHITLVQFKRLLEHARELANLVLESLLVRPSQRRVKHFTWNTIHFGRNLEPKDAKCLVFTVKKLPRVYGIDDATGVLEWATLARTKLATCPACVD